MEGEIKAKFAHSLNTHNPEGRQPSVSEYHPHCGYGNTEMYDIADYKKIQNPPAIGTTIPPRYLPTSFL